MLALSENSITVDEPYWQQKWADSKIFESKIFAQCSLEVVVVGRVDEWVGAVDEVGSCA